MGVPASGFKNALEDLIRTHLRNGHYPILILTDLQAVIPDVEGLVKYAGDYYQGLPNEKRDEHKK